MAVYEILNEMDEVINTIIADESFVISQGLKARYVREQVVPQPPTEAEVKVESPVLDTTPPSTTTESQS